MEQTRPGGRPLGDAAFYWTFQPDFGPYLRALREGKGLALREAAEELGLSFTKLQKLETGGRAKPPTLPLLDRIAQLYGRPQQEVFEKAGVVIEMPPDFYDQLNNRQAFAALLLHPELKPFKMTEDWIESFSERQRRQIIEYSLLLEDLVLKHGARCVSHIMERGLGDKDPG